MDDDIASPCPSCGRYVCRCAETAPPPWEELSWTPWWAAIAMNA